MPSQVSDMGQVAQSRPAVGATPHPVVHTPRIAAAVNVRIMPSRRMTCKTCLGKCCVGRCRFER